MPDLRQPKRPALPREPGTLLAGRFSIVRRISRGDLGEVYQARDTRHGNRWVAVKERDKMNLEPRLRELLIGDFKRGASILAQLEHPSIPTIYDHFIEDGIYYYVTKWVEGSDLAQQMRVRGGTVEEATVTKWAIQICDVL